MMKLRKIPKFLYRALPFLLIAAIVLCTAFFPKAREAEGKKRVVRIWNVDTFEGGKGSRTTFLRRAALLAEKQNPQVFYMIASYTPEGAAAAFNEGSSPDILSFGIGLSEYAESSLPLPVSFAGGETEEGCLAYPWCAGRYYLFSLTEDFETEGETVISKGGNNLPEAVAALEGIGGTTAESTAAYVGFLNGNYRYLLGTQRDECRFSARGVTVYSKALSAYCDLYQYISVLSSAKRADCLVFLQTLLSDEVQDALSDIGMYPLSSLPTYTVSAFIGQSALAELTELAQSGELQKNPHKYLKSI